MNHFRIVFIVLIVILAADIADAKNCKEGKICGNTCIAKEDFCHVDRESFLNGSPSRDGKYPSANSSSASEKKVSLNSPQADIYNEIIVDSTPNEVSMLTFQARNMPLRDVLQNIANHANVEIVAQGDVEQAVSADFRRTALEEALRRLTSDFNSIFLYDQKRMKKVLLYAKNAPSGGNMATQQETFRPGTPVPASFPPPSPRKIGTEEPPSSSEAEEEDSASDSESVAELMKSDDSALREEAVGMLANLEDGGGINQLSEMLLHDEDSSIRQLVAETLSSLGDRKAVRALGKALEDKNAEVRSMVVYALGQLGGEEARVLIKKAQKDRSQIVRQAAADALEMAADSGEE